jgi:hypothetical protein
MTVHEIHRDAQDRLIKDLKDLDRQKIIYRECGICTNVDIEDETLREIFKDWPEFSGDEFYPVETCYRGSWQYRNSSDKWGSGPYGLARKRLVKWMIELLESDETVVERARNVWHREAYGVDYF